jgi:hypothetical protein
MSSKSTGQASNRPAETPSLCVFYSISLYSRALPLSPFVSLFPLFPLSLFPSFCLSVFLSFSFPCFSLPVSLPPPSTCLPHSHFPVPPSPGRARPGSRRRVPRTDFLGLCQRRRTHALERLHKVTCPTPPRVDHLHSLKAMAQQSSVRTSRHGIG